MNSLAKKGKFFARSAISKCLEKLGHLDRKLSSTNNSVWLVMTYHRVIADSGDDPFQLGMCVKENHFSDQMKWLSSKFEVWTPQDVVNCMQSGETLPRKLASVTFDDGYLDNLENAAPILDLHKCPWAIYVATDAVEGKRPFWWDIAIQATRNCRVSSLELSELAIEGLVGNLRMNSLNIAESLETLLTQLWTLPTNELRYRAVSRLAEHLNSPVEHDLPKILGPEQVKQLSDSGVEIGAHSQSHPDLAALTEEGTRNELTRSRSLIEQWTGTNVQGCAYPGGFSSRSVEKVAEDSGFSYAMGTDRGWNDGDFQRFNVNRVGAPDDTSVSLKFSLSMLPLS